VASSSIKHVVDGSWNTQNHGVHASIAGVVNLHSSKHNIMC
jgi:hypothetical protein